MPGIIGARVRLGMSACVAGCPVRYNGKSFDALRSLGREASDYVVTPVCRNVSAVSASRATRST